MTLDATALPEFGLEPAADLLTRGFSDYFVKIAFTAAAFERMARADSLDLAASRVFRHEGVPVGVALIARRALTSRLAGMAIVPEARKRGFGRAIMEGLAADAGNRGDHEMVLEVIEHNAPAVSLYEGAGFRKVRRLVGFEGGPPSEPGAAELPEEVAPEAAAAAMSDGIADLPWQATAATLAAQTPPCRVFRLEGAWAALSNVDAATVAIRGLGPEPGPAGPGKAVRLLRALMARYPGKQWRMSALWPEEFSGLFIAAGFVRSPLSQWQMARAISPRRLGT